MKNYKSSVIKERVESFAREKGLYPYSEMVDKISRFYKLASSRKSFYSQETIGVVCSLIDSYSSKFEYFKKEGVHKKEVFDKQCKDLFGSDLDPKSVSFEEINFLFGEVSNNAEEIIRCEKSLNSLEKILSDLSPRPLSKSS